MPTYGKPIRSIQVCDACEKDWEQWIAVEFDRWLSAPKGAVVPNTPRPAPPSSVQK
jgi:hypothetical protein